MKIVNSGAMIAVCLVPSQKSMKESSEEPGEIDPFHFLIDCVYKYSEYTYICAIFGTCMVKKNTN